jgi:hypothetical protein
LDFLVQFLQHHPFADGNGRTARLIGAYLLLWYTQLAPAPLINFCELLSLKDNVVEHFTDMMVDVYFKSI